jgi:hypothetical protein
MHVPHPELHIKKDKKNNIQISRKEEPQPKPSTLHHQPIQSLR